MNFLEKMWLVNKGRIVQSQWRIFLMFSLPIIVTYLFELILTKIYIERFYNFIENLCFAFILILPAYIIKRHFIKIFYLKVLFVFLVFMLFLETGYYFIFNSKFSASSVFIVSETNFNEAKEFFLFYLNKKLFMLLFSLMLLTLFFLLKSRVFLNNVLDAKRKSFVLILFLFFSISLILVSYTRRENLPYIIIKSFYDLNKDSYFYNLSTYKDFFGPFKEALGVEKENEKTVVIVIGESISKHHLNLYGYKRITTPLLNNFKDDILIYNNVITSHALTADALKKALTLNSENNNGTIIQLLNSAGYQTYWFSNQNPIGLHESLVSKIASSSYKKKFLTSARFNENTIYDELLLLELDDALNDNEKRKVIFIHLQGAHFKYDNRYPDSYNIFKDIPQTKFYSEKSKEIINSYDNAILYNDFVVSSIINRVKEKNTESTVLYFSDHGEEVYDTIDFSGHTDDNGTLPMFQIPFILWQSRAYMANNKIEIDLDRAYMTDDLFHSIAHLTGVKSVHLDFERSIFSDKFKKSKRIILNNKDYDSILNVDKNKN